MCHLAYIHYPRISVIFELGESKGRKTVARTRFRNKGRSKIAKKSGEKPLGL
jgi:hypothetical protein